MSHNATRLSNIPFLSKILERSVAIMWCDVTKTSPSFQSALRNLSVWIPLSSLDWNGTTQSNKWPPACFWLWFPLYSHPTWPLCRFRHHCPLHPSTTSKKSGHLWFSALLVHLLPHQQISIHIHQQLYVPYHTGQSRSPSRFSARSSSVYPVHASPWTYHSKSRTQIPQLRRRHTTIPQH